MFKTYLFKQFNGIMGYTVEKIQSNKYYYAARKYFVDHKDPSMVYAFLLNTLWADKYKLPEKMFYERVDMLETTDACVRFYTGTECVLVLYSNLKNEAKELTFMDD
jgi:hypothetical protein